MKSRIRPWRRYVLLTQAWIWGAPGAHPGRGGLRALRVALLSTRAYRDNHLEFYASGLSFFLLMSVVPFLAFILMMVEWLGVSSEGFPRLLLMITGGDETLAALLTEYANNARPGLVGGVGVTLAAAVGYLLLQRVKTALNMIREVERWASYRHRMGEYLTILVSLPLMLATMVGTMGLLSGGAIRTYLKTLGLLAPAQYLLVDFIGYFLLWLANFYAYAFLPDVATNKKIAAVTAVGSTVGLVLAENTYLSFVVSMSRQNLIYGALALLPALMAWFYLAWLVFLLGAQVAFVVQNYSRLLDLRRMALAESEAWWTLEQERWSV